MLMKLLPIVNCIINQANCRTAGACQVDLHRWWAFFNDFYWHLAVFFFSSNILPAIEFLPLKWALKCAILCAHGRLCLLYHINATKFTLIWMNLNAFQRQLLTRSIIWNQASHSVYEQVQAWSIITFSCQCFKMHGIGWIQFMIWLRFIRLLRTIVWSPYYGDFP